jgi:hypothetical protein
MDNDEEFYSLFFPLQVPVVIFSPKVYPFYRRLSERSMFEGQWNFLQRVSPG